MLLFFQIFLNTFIKLTTITFKFKDFLIDLIMWVANFDHETFKLLNCIYCWFFIEVFLEFLRQNSPKFSNFKFFHLWFEIKLKILSLCDFSINELKEFWIEIFVFQNCRYWIVSVLQFLNPKIILLTKTFQFFISIFQFRILNEFPNFDEFIRCDFVVIVSHEDRLIMTLKEKVISCSNGLNQVIKSWLILKWKFDSFLCNWYQDIDNEIRIFNTILDPISKYSSYSL